MAHGRHAFSSGVPAGPVRGSLQQFEDQGVLGGRSVPSLEARRVEDAAWRLERPACSEAPRAATQQASGEHDLASTCETLRILMLCTVEALSSELTDCEGVKRTRGGLATLAAG